MEKPRTLLQFVSASTRPVLKHGIDAQGLEAAFPFRKTLAAVALNPYQARGRPLCLAVTLH